MNWHGKAISSLSDDQLKSAQSSISYMEDYRNDKLSNKKERHKEFNLENTNPVFETIKNEIEEEIVKRKI